MRSLKLVLLVSLFFLCACEQEDLTETLGSNNLLIGTWVEQPELSLEQASVDGSLILNRRQVLDSTQYGFIIGKDGSFIERKNAGWCGTPPITYKNFEGTWEAVSDSLLEITVGYWGGTINYQMRIVNVDNEMLRIRYLFSNDRASAR